LQTIRQSEIKRLDEENELERQGEIQAEREMIQNTMIQKNILKFQGKLKGSPWDPLPGDDIPYSAFMQLLEDKRIQYVDYGEFGQYLAGSFHHLVPLSVLKSCFGLGVGTLQK
jgi:hypothetical protein